MRTFFSQLGASLPGANPSKHGQVNIKQAAATEDEAYLVLRDSSGVLQYRRLVTTTLADSTYALEVKEGNSSVDTGVTVLDFDASDFTVSESPEGEINLGLAYGTSAGTPAEGNHTHTNPGITVSEGGSAVDTSVTTLDFDASDFNLSESPEDEINISLNYGTGAGQPAEGDHTHAASFHVPQPGQFPKGIAHSPTTNTSIASNTTMACYMGVAAAAYTSIVLRVNVSTGAATITWAEAGVGTSPVITFAGSASITRRGSTDTSGVVNAIGQESITVSVSGISAGDHLWALFGSQATTPAQYDQHVTDSLLSGLVQEATSTRISTMASPTAFTAVGQDGPAGYWIGSE
jgi:hypothetical protein